MARSQEQAEGGSEHYQTRLSHPRKEFVEEFRDENDLTKSEALRQLVDERRRAERQNRRFFRRSAEQAIGWTIHLLSAMIVFCLFVWFAGAAGLVTGAGVGAVVSIAGYAALALVAGALAFRAAAPHADHAINRLLDEPELEIDA